MTADEKSILEEKIINVLKNVFDPEIPVNIYDLGLVYEINISDEGNVKVMMTLTAPNCPVADSLPLQVKEEIAFLTGVKEADVEIVFDPPWDMEMISEEGKLELGLL